MAIIRNAVIVSLEDAELHIRSGLPGGNSIDCLSTDTSMLRLRVENRIIEVWFVNLERCKSYTPLISYLKHQIRLILWCLDVELSDFEGTYPQDAVPWITVSPRHKVFHLENLVGD
jgi:hypothetical protein